MRTFFKNAKPGWEWFQEKAKTPHARMWLGAYSFFETLLLPFPTDIFLAIMVYADKARAWTLTFLTTATSVLGAVVGYVAAYFFSATLGEMLITYAGVGGEVDALLQTLGHYAFFAVFLGAFTPIPYTPVVYAAGFLQADFFIFLAASVLGRGLRYVLVTGITLLFGTASVSKLQKYATHTTVLLCGLVLLGVGVFIFFH